MAKKIIETRYQLDTETLLLFLSNWRQSGELSADLRNFPGIAYHGHCHAYVTVVQGKVVSCFIRSSEGRVLAEGETALSGLKRMGQLDWTWALAPSPMSTFHSLPALPHADPPAPTTGGPADIFSLIPRRIVLTGMREKNELPRRHWRVLILIDGSRTVAQIASILSLTSLSGTQELISILNDLQQRGIILVAK